MNSRKGFRCFKLLPVALLLLAMTVPGRAVALYVQGTIDSDSSWTLDDSPVHITGDLVIGQEATLTVDPGVTVIFEPRPNTERGYRLIVNGTLAARGSETLPILFTAQDPDLPWGAIIFGDTAQDWNDEESTGSILSGCIVEYGGNDPDYAAMVFTENAMPRIIDNVIRFSDSAGITGYTDDSAASDNGDIRIIDNRIHSNSTGVILYGEGGQITGNYFIDNTRALDITHINNDLSIQSNTIISSSSVVSGAGLLLQMEEPSSGIRTYYWEQTDGPSVTLENADSAQLLFTAPNPGSDIATLTFDLTVTGASGGQDTDSISVTVIGSNELPVASGGSDQNIQIAQDTDSVVEVTLNGRGSYDSDLGLSGFEWRQESGSSVTLENSTSMICTFEVPSLVSAGDEVVIELTVTDLGGLQDTDTVTIRFYDENVYPLAVAGDDITTLESQIVHLDGSGSSDSDGVITSYLWTQTGGTAVTLYNANTGKPYFVAPAVDGNEETLTFNLEVQNDDGLTDTDELFVTVTAEKDVIAEPGENVTVAAGDEVTLDGSDSTDQGQALGSELNIEENVIESDNSDAGLVALTAAENSASQLYFADNNLLFADDTGFTVLLFDWDNDLVSIDMLDNWWGTDDEALIDEGIFDGSDDSELPVVIFEPFAALSVDGAGSDLVYPAMADAGSDIETSMDQEVTLDGTGSYDPEDIGEYLWEQVGGTEVTLIDSQSPTATFIAPSGGTDGEVLQFSLTLTTDGIFTHTDEITVTVTPDEDLPVVDIGGEGGCFMQSVFSQTDNANRASMTMILIAIGGLLMFRALLSRGHKTIPMILTLTVCVLFSTSNANAGFFAIGGGNGGDAEQYNVTIEAGAKDISSDMADFLFSIGIPLLPHGDKDIPENTIAAPCPNDQWVPLGTFAKGTEVGLYLKLGIELGSSNMYLNAIGGGTAVPESELALSPFTGNTYEQSSDTTIEPLYGGGLSFFPEIFGGQFVIQADYDNRRGVTGTMGWYW